MVIFMVKVECVNADIEGNFNGELIVSDLLSLKVLCGYRGHGNSIQISG